MVVRTRGSKTPVRLGSGHATKSLDNFVAGFALRLLAKEVGIANGSAHAVGSASPLADLVTDLLASARPELGPAVDHTRAYEAWRPS